MYFLCTSPEDNQGISFGYQYFSIPILGVPPVQISATSETLRCSQSSVNPGNLFSGTFCPFRGNIFSRQPFLNLFSSSILRACSSMALSCVKRISAIFFCSSKGGNAKAYLFRLSKYKRVRVPPNFCILQKYRNLAVLFSTEIKKLKSQLSDDVNTGYSLLTRTFSPVLLMLK